MASSAIAARPLADAVVDDVRFFASLGIALIPEVVSVISDYRPADSCRRAGHKHRLAVSPGSGGLLGAGRLAMAEYLTGGAVDDFAVDHPEP